MGTVVHTPTPKLSDSVHFYEALGFSCGGTGERPLMSDGQFDVEINADRSARAGLRLTQPSWSAEIQKLRDVTPVHEVEGGHVLADPSNVWIYLSEGDSKDDAATQRRADLSSCILGSFAGLSLETTDMERSARIWGLLGFETDSDLKAAWVSAKNADDFIVTWMAPQNCPHLFFNPSLTFFNSGRNPEIIKEIRTAGVPIAEEITVFNDEGVVDNVIVRDPGGYGMFVFND